MKTLIVLSMLLLLFVSAGCTTSIPNPQKKGDMVNAWRHSAGDGPSHRYSLMADGTELLSIGHHDFGTPYLLIRYAGQREFTVIYADKILTIGESEDSKAHRAAIKKALRVFKEANANPAGDY